MLLTVSLAACAADTPAEPRDPGTEKSPTGLPIATAPTEMPSASAGTTGTVDPPETHMEAIRADLDGRGVSGSDATLVEAHRKTWNTGALGCPLPGVSYTQALVEGWQVVVKDGDKTYDYRFGTDATPTLCENSMNFIGIPAETPTDI